MTYILDTNICIYWLKGDRDIEAKALEVGLEALLLSFVTICELYFGAYKSQKIKDNILNIEKLKDRIRVVESNDLVCETFGKLKAFLVKKEVIDDADILVAACALMVGATLVTNNEKHFKRIKGLKVENWVST
ncbi:MAG: PIN domain-containing protein [Deltaproteobacteria bacterium]|nr:PIN domain-containing protein [Deltaproteobacteria bacterium]